MDTNDANFNANLRDGVCLQSKDEEGQRDHAAMEELNKKQSVFFACYSGVICMLP